MAILITNSTPFKPMSFDELIKPHLLATEAYNEIEKGIADLDAEATTIKQLAMSEPEGSETRTRYEQYAAELESKASDLASKGLRGINKKSLYDLQAQYNNKIKPIDTAAKIRAAEIAEQKEGMKDPTMRYSRNAATTSLDYYLNNTAPTYDRLSGATLAAQTKDMVSGIAKQMREDPRKWESILGGQYYQTKMQQGYTDEEILLAAINDPNAPRELTNIVRNVIDSSRLLDWEGARDSEGNLTGYGRELEDWAWKEASKGLWGAAGETTYNIQSNKQWDNQAALDLHLKKAAIDLAKFEDQERLKAYYKGLSEGKGQASDIMNRIFIGASGETSEAIERLQGLRVNNNGGITTTKIDNFTTKEINLQNELNSSLVGLSDKDIASVKKKYNDEKNSTVEGSQYLGYSGIGYSYKRAQENLLSPLAAFRYNKIKRILDEKREYENKREQEQNYIREVYNKYSHLLVGDASDPNNIKNAISLGVALEDSQEKQQDYIATIKYKNDSERKTININYGNQLDGMYGRDTDNIGTAGLYSIDDGKRISGEDFKKINMDDANIGIFRNKDGIQIQLTSDGKAYSFNGIESITRAEKTINAVDKFLKDFSKAGLSAEMLYDENGPTVYNSNDLLNAKPQYKPKHLEGTNYYYDITYDEGTGTWAKVIINPNTGLPLYTNTLNDEIAGGDYRDYVIGSLLEMQLTSMLPRE